MNRAIFRLFAVMTLLFVLLVAFTSRWTVFSQAQLDNNSLNKLTTYASWKVKRGDLLADNGDVLAKSVPASGDTWSRKYPFGSLFAQTVGYSDQQEGAAAGMEQYFAPQLSGPTGSLTSLFGSFSGGRKVGDDVYTTLDPRAQALARTELNGDVGSVVAIVPNTGAVKVMYSNPTYDDNDPTKYENRSECPYDLSTCPGAERVGDETSGAVSDLLPPGSTFKVVTTTAALTSGKFTPNSIINGDSPREIDGKALNNDADTSYGPVSLTYALTQSIDTVYAQVGQDLGAKVMQQYMKRFGFYSVPPLDYPTGAMSASGEIDQTTGKLLPLVGAPCTSYYNCPDIGRMAMGQDKLGVTPLQMAMVAAAVANDGKLMEPRLATKVVNNDGEVVQRFAPTEYDQVMKPKVAKEVTNMMADVVQSGTGTSAALQGIQVAGKTGTATTGGCTKGILLASSECSDGGLPLDDAWFIAFAPVAHPKIAVAVEVSDVPEGYGADYAAPIAAKMIKTLLAEEK